MEKINDKLYNWASIADPAGIRQAEMTARLPFVERVALMPDMHVGLGATVGSVIGMNGAIVPSAVGVDVGCLDGETEFLSPDGWVRIDEWKNHLVLGYDVKRGVAAFCQPQRYITASYPKMFHLKSAKGLDQVVSPDHRMLFFKGVKNRGYTSVVSEAAELVENHERLAKGLQGGFLATFLTNSGRYNLTLDELRVQIMVSADGSLRERTSTPNVVECHFRKPRKIARCEELLSNANIEFKRYDHKDGTVTFLFVPPMWTKSLSFLYACDTAQLTVAAEESIVWDGSDNTIDGTCRRFYVSSVKKNADAIQYAFAATGVRAGIFTQTYPNHPTWKPCYFVIPTKNKYVGIPPGSIQRITAENSTGIAAYCFTMPTGFFVARRNNNIFITGNCGMLATKYDLVASQLPDDLQRLMPLVERAVPAGVGQGHAYTHDRSYTWLRNNRSRFATDLDSRLEAKALEQFGSLGSGNHFVEVCLDEDDNVWTVLHSGSRGLGNIIASTHIKTAKDVCDREGRHLESKDLAWFAENDPEFQLYIDDLLVLQDYAAANRNQMASALDVAFTKHFLKREVKIVEQINCHHNYTVKETHFGKSMWVTRKGAINAEVGSKGIIPGSMGARTHIVEGLGNPDSFCSCSHGAGRVYSRSEAKRLYTGTDLAREMGDRAWNKDRAAQLVDEIPQAYKPLERVMEDQKDLVRSTAVLSQIFNYKG